jgi:hypothetical protein
MSRRRDRPFATPPVARAFAAFPPRIRRRLLALRALVFETAAATDGVGAIEESLRWGEPAYLTTASRSGSTIRLGWKRAQPTRYAMYFHCQTDLVATFRRRFPDVFEFEGNRALVFEDGDAVPTDALRECIVAALTYRRTHRWRPER